MKYPKETRRLVNGVFSLIFIDEVGKPGVVTPVIVENLINGETMTWHCFVDNYDDLGATYFDLEVFLPYEDEIERWITEHTLKD